MVKKLSISLLLFLILAQVFDKFGLITYYNLNKEYITEVFCINKEKPELECDGKCYLIAKLKKQEEEKSEFPLSDFSIKDIQFIFDAFGFSPIKKSLAALNHSGFYYLSAHPQDFFKRIFHPPKY